MVRLLVNFRSGRQIALNVTDWKLTHGRADGKIREFSWTPVENAKTSLIHADVDEIESIVREEK